MLYGAARMKVAPPFSAARCGAGHDVAVRQALARAVAAILEDMTSTRNNA
jgi:hypothetical protein